ncbi:class I SAM-dependent methyltransferase [Flavilitoribacter nigricans]|uniref:class I SAM-dependent methyltransferase n=1 Tax=Flavilitoribacter nigricans TaxID=70997 RepID=UPI001F425922|nr:class I SAM-dependent methyltransferase [Flavilitoribacter nigricans]
MHKTRITSSIKEQNQTIATYYQFQSGIYDLTRWSFLFGRKRIVRELPFQREALITILEVGCGTGYNLAQLARHYPNARLQGMDLSADMLQIAKRNTRRFGNRVELIQAPYGQSPLSYRPDVILFSYALTMINPQWKDLLDRAGEDLADGGIIAVADFHDSRHDWFRNHMGNHHVRIDGHLLPILSDRFKPLLAEVKPAYFGVWDYLVFVGARG